MPFNDILGRLNSTVLGRIGESAVVDSIACKVAFIEPYEEIALGGVSAASSHPQIVGATSDFPENPVGKSAVVRGVNYRVVEATPDSFGARLLSLELVL